jgi:hypothetical protein
VIILSTDSNRLRCTGQKHQTSRPEEDVMKRFAIVTAVIITGCLTATLYAGFAYAGPTDDPGIQQREQNQERRIQQGIKSGELTPREAGRLEAQQARISQREERMKADGKLTKAERRVLHHDQNAASRNIYRKKHNNRTAAVQ